ncbi:DNA repair protein, putative [Bodo saltans]|uniref:DNA repair protein, putative n=1 Tax=Bodo saltans TaxID=75058 RepID=A0A0S4JJI1_BODSA|nr:DNA repair protein, putative [Bodo saltans]|eukprot:CUG90423.1 DNA repair protein, putative [Bodo saltans]
MSSSYHHSTSYAPRRFQASTNAAASWRPKHIEVSAEWVTPLHQHRHESLVRGNTSNNDSGSGGNASSSQPQSTTSRIGTVPLYFNGSVDEWHRIEALRPFMSNLVADTTSPQTAAGGGSKGTVRMGIEHSGRRQFDIVIGPHKGGVVMVHFTHLLREGVRTLIHNRISSLGAAGQSSSVHFLSCCLLMVDVEEPQQDTLSWINLLCLEHRVTLQLCWSWQDAKAAIDGIDEGGGGDGYGGGAHQQHGGRCGPGRASAVQTMMTALSQTPALMSKQDVIRAANKVNTVAELLLLTEAALSGLPGIGPKKAKRIEGVFHAPFPTTEARLNDVLWLDDTDVVAPPPSAFTTVVNNHPSWRTEEETSDQNTATVVPTTNMPSLRPTHESVDAPRHAPTRGSSTSVQDTTMPPSSITGATNIPTPRRLPNASTAFKEALNKMMQQELDNNDEE